MFEFTDQAFAGVQRCGPPTAAAASHGAITARSGRHPVEAAHRSAMARCAGRFGPWQSCHGRLRRWQRDGTWPRRWAVLAAGEHGCGQDRCGQAGQPVLAAAPVTAARAGLMATPPPRPPQHLPHCRWRPPPQGDQQPPRLRGRDPDQVRTWRAWRLWPFCALSCPPLRPGRGPPPGTPGRPAPGSYADTRHPSGGPGSGPGRPGPWRPGSTP